MRRFRPVAALSQKAGGGRPEPPHQLSREVGNRLSTAAVPATSYLKSDPERAQRYFAAYENAEARHAGVHASYFIDPAKWRRGERLSCEARGKSSRER